MKKNITFSADDGLIHKARMKAHKNKTTLNLAFRKWLTQYAMDTEQTIDYYALMKQFKHIKAGKHSSRDELNER